MQTLSPIKTGAFLYQGKRLNELTQIRSVSIKLLKLKKDRLKLEDKFQKTKDKFTARQKVLDREKAQETKKKITKKSKLVRTGQDVVSAGIIDLLMTFIKFKALMWLGDPENLKKVQAIVKGLSGIFKFIDWFATGSVNNLLNGLHSLLFGGSILERILGLFSAIVGFFGIRYLLNPFKLIKDLKFVIKNGDKIGDIFNAFKKSGIKEGAANLVQGLTKTASIFKRGLARGLVRAVLKVFGKGGLKFLAKAAAPAVGGLLKLVGGPLKAIASKSVAGIPVVGPLLNLGINLLLGDPVDKAIVKTVGSTLGMGLGAVVGSVFPGPGTIVGGALGGIVGDWAASNLYDWMKSAFSKKEEPALAVGGIVTKPTRALIGEAGPEAVIPLGQIYNGSMMSAPLGIIASSMIGGIDALLASMGSVGLSIRPFAQQLLSPYTRQFGKKNYTFTSDIAKKSGNVNVKIGASEEEKTNEELNKIVGAGLPLSILQKKETEKQERYNPGNSMREILADILNNIMNLDFSKESPGGPGGTPDGTVNTSGSFNGSANAEKAFNYLKSKGLTSEQAAGLVGNFMQEAGINIDPKITNSIGHKGIAQWDPRDRWPKLVRFARSKNLNPESLEAQLQFVWYELETGDGGLSLPTLKSAKTVKQAAHLFVTQYERSGERPGHHGYENRITYGNQVFSKYAKMQTGGVVSTQGVPDTGPGYTIDGAKDKKGRPVVFSQAAASAFAKMMKDSDGVVKPSDVESSKRSLEKNRSLPGAASKSKHLYGIAMDIHGSSAKWIRANGFKYGWIANDYPGSHGGHFEFGGQGIQPSDTSQTNNATAPQDQPAATWETIAPALADLAKLLTGEPKINSNALATQSMDFVQASKLPSLVPDTYIIPQQVTMASSFNLIQPMPQTDYSQGAFAQIDSSSYLSQRRL
jgi:uncharacterized membrane protein required for colicin V production